MVLANRKETGVISSVPEPEIESKRTFLILQGPPSSFYKKMAREIEACGGHAIKVNLNAGDWLYSLGMRTVNFRGSSSEWPSWVREFTRANKVTDLVLYGDCREYHKVAISMLRPMGVIIHVLEEGYMRPTWITYERNGVNGYSRLADISLADIDKKKVLETTTNAGQNIKDTIWPYIFAGIFYYGATYWARPAFPFYRNHRPQGILEEAWIWLKRIPFLPQAKLDAKFRGARLTRGTNPYFLVLLQLPGDFQVREHGGFQSISEFIEMCIRAFSAAASPSERLVFKSHPLDSSTLNLKREIERIASRYDVDEQCELIDGGKLAYLTNNARGVVSINSTACQVSLRRGIPTKVLGRAIYNHRPLAAGGSLEEFFTNPETPDIEAYELFHRFLLLTVQINGSFYSDEGIRQAIKPLVAKMMAKQDPVDPFIRVLNPAIVEIKSAAFGT